MNPVSHIIIFPSTIYHSFKPLPSPWSFLLVIILLPTLPNPLPVVTTVHPALSPSHATCPAPSAYSSTLPHTCTVPPVTTRWYAHLQHVNEGDLMAWWEKACRTIRLRSRQWEASVAAEQYKLFVPHVARLMMVWFGRLSHAHTLFCFETRGWSRRVDRTWAANGSNAELCIQLE